MAVFFNRYEELGALQYGALVGGLTPTGYPALFQDLNECNLALGETYGFELAAGYTLNDRWRLRGSYSFLRMTLRTLSPDCELLEQPGDSPRNQFNLWLSGDLSKSWHLDVVGRYVDNLPALSVPSYFVADVRLAWKPRKNFEMFVVGRNLLDENHVEYSTGDTTSAVGFGVEQEVFGGINWVF